MDAEIQRLRKKVDNYPSPSAYNRLAELLRLQEDHNEAGIVCQRCIHEFPRNGQAYVIQASIFLRQQQHEEAIAQLRKAVAQDKRCYSAYRLLADLLAEGGAIAESIRCLRSILNFKPNDEAVEQRLTELQGRLDKNGQQDPAVATNRIAGHNADSPAIDLSLMASTMTTSMAKPTAAKPEAIQPASSKPPPALAGLCDQEGVHGAAIIDLHGRVLVSEGLEPDEDDILAAYSVTITAASDQALGSVAAGTTVSWSLQTEEGQIFAFRRDDQLILVLKASPTIKTALLELRSRQALIDLEKH